MLKLPAFRDKSSPHQSGSSPGQARPRVVFARLLSLRNITIVLVLLSLYQYARGGAVTWPADTFEKITRTIIGYAGRPAAGWRRATDAIGQPGADGEGQALPAFGLTGRVVRIFDGDTLSLLDDDNTQHTIRLFGIDTPEVRQPHAKEASRALAALVAQQTVGVVVHDTDLHGRTVGSVYLGDTYINLAMVAAGHAWWYRKWAPYQRSLAEGEQQARKQKLGLWANPDPVPPWDWRQQRH